MNVMRASGWWVWRIVFSPYKWKPKNGKVGNSCSEQQGNHREDSVAYQFSFEGYYNGQSRKSGKPGLKSHLRCVTVGLSFYTLSCLLCCKMGMKTMQ